MITVDLSKDMIEKSAELRATEKKGEVGSRIEEMAVVGDEEFLPFGDRYVSAVYAISVLTSIRTFVLVSQLRFSSEAESRAHIIRTLMSRFRCCDVVISSLGLHWVNDLPGAMTQVCILNSASV